MQRTRPGPAGQPIGSARNMGWTRLITQPLHFRPPGLTPWSQFDSDAVRVTDGPAQQRRVCATREI